MPSRVLIAAAVLVVAAAGGAAARAVLGGDDPRVANLWIDGNGGACVRTAEPRTYADRDACVSLDAAYDASRCGDVVLIRAGTYRDAAITGPRECDRRTVLAAETAGSVVVDGTIDLGMPGDSATTPDHLTLRGLETALSGEEPIPESRYGIGVYQGASDIVIEDSTLGSFLVWGAQDVTLRRNRLGPCDSVGNVEQRVCGHNRIDYEDSPETPTRNILVEDNVVHDYRFDDSCFEAGADCHWECMYVNVSDRVTIRGNVFTGCAIMDLFLTHSNGAGSIVLASGHRDLVVENNWFDRPYTEASYRAPERRDTALRVGNCGTVPESGVHFERARIRFNSFASGASISLPIPGDEPQCMQQGGFLLTGNVLTTPGTCYDSTWVTWEANLFDGATGCGARAARHAGSLYVRDSGGGDLDLHLAGDPGGTPADDLVPSGCPAHDIDGERRPAGDRCDAGADERG